MAGVYLDGVMAPDLFVVIRDALAPGLVTAWDGYKTRSRSSGGFPKGPMGIVVHHTASPARTTPGQQFSGDASYCAVGHQDSPVGNAVLGPEGQVSVHAAGSANTQGKGGPWTTSRGVVSLDNGNANLLAVEASNDGQGQPWSPAQCDSYVRIVRAMAAAYGLRLDRWGTFAADVLSHEEWCRPSCPGRKCDPAGPSPWSPSTTGGCSAGNLWSMDAFRASCAAGVADEEDEPMGYLYRDPRYANVFLIGQGPATPVPTVKLAELRAKLGEEEGEPHQQTLTSICQQAWGMTVDQAVAARMLVP